MEELKAVEQELSPRVAEERGMALAPVPNGEDKLGPYDARRFEGAGALALAKEQQAILTAPLAPDEISFDPPGQYQRKGPDGVPMLYLSHIHARRRLFAAFGVGGWAMRPVENPIMRQAGTQMLVLAAFDLVVGGKFVGRAVGECAYNPTNPRMTEGDAIEGAMSNALTRICQKALGMGLELFERRERERLHALATLPTGKNPPETIKQQAAAAGAPVAAAAEAQRQAKNYTLKVDATGLRRFHAVRGECGLDDVEGKKILAEFGLTSSRDIPAAKLETICRRMKQLVGMEPPDGVGEV